MPTVNKHQPKAAKTNLIYFLNSLVLGLFILLLPTQLGKHFFLSFSYLSGVRVDYLAPTVYTTDILAFILLMINWKQITSFFTNNRDLLLVLLLLLVNLVFAPAKELAAYRYLKIVELLAVFAFFSQTKIDKQIVALGLTISVVAQMGLVVFQFVNKHSLQAAAYWFGERYLSLSMPGIAKASIQGVEFLRPYATFSHPNSMAGFYLLLYTFVLTTSFFTPLWKKIFLIVSTLIIFFSFSKVAILTLLLINLIYFVHKKKYLDCLPCFISQIIVFVVLGFIFLTAKTDSASVNKRLELLQSSLIIISRYPFTGVGLGNYLVIANKINPASLFPFQPVHNIGLLFLAEVGLVLGGFIAYKLWQYFRSKPARVSLILCLLSVVVTGMFDHYWWSLQQNWLLLGVVFGLLKFG